MQPYLVYLTMEGVRGLGLGLIITAPIYRLDSAGFGPLELVLAGTALEIAYFASEVPTGIVADVYSRRLSCIAGAFIMGAAWLLEGSFAVLAPIMIGQALLGFGWTFFSGAAEAWIAGEIGEDRAAHAIVRGRQTNLGASIIGGFLSAVFATVQLNVPILVAGGSHIILGFFLIFAMKEFGFTGGGVRGSRLSALTDTFRGGSRAVRGSPVLILILVVSFLTGTASEGLDRLWEAHLWIDHALRDSQDAGLFALALIGGVATASSVAALSLSRRWVEGESDRVLARTAVVLTFAIAAGCTIFGFAPGLYVAVGAYWAVRIARNVLDPTITVWVVRHADPQYRATVLSMEGQSHSVGEIIAGPLVGYIGRVISVPAALVTSAIMQALAVPVLAREALRAPADPPTHPTRLDPLAPPAQSPGAEPTATEL